MHLSDVELVDLAEGTRPESSAPHLAVCERCRHQLLELRRMIGAAAAVPVPEPSPLFWDRFSDRVRHAVAAEAIPPRRWGHDLASASRVLIPASAVAVIALLVGGVVATRGPRMPASNVPLLSQPPGATVEGGAGRDTFEEAALDDESLTLMADLSAAIDVDLVTDAVLAPSAGADHAVTNLDHDELRELERLLNELAPSGV
jgi:hypothetical protein